MGAEPTPTSDPTTSVETGAEFGASTETEPGQTHDHETRQEQSLRHRRRLRRVLFVLLTLVAVDLALPPRYQLSSRLLLTSINAYQATLSKQMPRMGVQCRFTPTCSHYGEEAIRRYGTARGGSLAAWRILRCGPWTAADTYDPVTLEPSTSEGEYGATPSSSPEEVSP